MDTAEVQCYVLKCHIHETFLHIILHGNTENTPKTAHSRAYQYSFCISALILTFIMKHLTPPLFPVEPVCPGPRLYQLPANLSERLYRLPSHLRGGVAIGRGGVILIANS